MEDSVEVKPKIPFPKAIFFIIVNEFCERFSHYGMRAVLSLYLRDVLHYTEHTAKSVYHSFIMLAFFFPLIGAIIADSFLGKYRTILYVSMIYAMGNVILTISAVGTIPIPHTTIALLGLFLIAVGTGGIKPCISSFGGDQFILPDQQKQLDVFFGAFYFVINVGSLMSSFTTPLMRERVSCFSKLDCFPLSFGVPGILMILAIIIFLCGRSFYIMRKAETNIVWQWMKCVGHGIKSKIKASDRVDHWLDRSEERFGKPFVKDVKATLQVIVVFIPLPIFWTLYDQQGSGWTFQATRMNGRLGPFTILPDQMQITNPLLILIFIPTFTYGIYPLFTKCNLLTKPLTRMVIGGLIAALSFFACALLALALEKNDPVVPQKENCHIRVYNSLNCSLKLTARPLIDGKIIQASGYEMIDVKVKGKKKSVDYEIIGCEGEISGATNGSNFSAIAGKSMVYHINVDGLFGAEDDVVKHKEGLPKIRTLLNNPQKEFHTVYQEVGGEVLKIAGDNRTIVTLKPGVYTIKGYKETFHFDLGGVFTILVTLNGKEIKNVKVYEITKANSIHMLWLLPQYILITAAEIMVSVTGLEFSYTQAPVSMKAVLTAIWLMTTALGNLIVVIIESANFFSKQSHNFFLYGAIMTADMGILALLARRYKYASEID